ncbi:unnamed protein product [Rhodiola kirilowii]
MNNCINAEFTFEDVERAVFQLSPSKAPGCDGFSAVFFQKFWPEVKFDVATEVLQFFDNGTLNLDQNRTMITLIPKLKQAKRIEDFRPISLCSVFMKIISKMMMSRVQPFLDQIISSNQSAFVKGRVISDNILIAQELMHFLKGRKKQKKAYASLKLDMNKAYDRVEWDFLENMLLRLGFEETWIHKIMICVRTVTYVVRVNDDLTETIIPSRGLRQGDPLSLYLFIICMEWLSARINKSMLERKFGGLKICRDAPNISHLFFADDSLIFLKARASEADELLNILSEYEKLSGQKVNFLKSEICFSKNTNDDVRKAVKDLLNIKEVDCHSKYLGLQLVAGQKLSAVCGELVEKLWSKLQSWENLKLSVGGREILIKAVLQAIPQYTMSCVYLPESIINKLSSAIVNF